jgi:L-serine/L-threonine ammonia-lyase
LQRVGWQDTEVIAVETDGAQSLHSSIQAGQLITLPAITSIAKSLGARTVAAQALAYCQIHPVRSVVVSDEAALRACRQFAQSQRALVEPACGAALSIVYDDHEALASAKRVAVIACGGVSIGSVMEFGRGMPDQR